MHDVTRPEDCSQLVLFAFIPRINAAAPLAWIARGSSVGSGPARLRLGQAIRVLPGTTLQVVQGAACCAWDEPEGHAQADGEGPHEALEVGDGRRDERVRQHDLLQEEAPRDGELGLLPRGGRRRREERVGVPLEEREVEGREADEGQAEDEGQEDLELEGAGQLARPDEDDGEGADAQLGEDVDGRDGLPAGVLPRLASWVLSIKAGRGRGFGIRQKPTWLGHVVTCLLVSIVLASQSTPRATIEPNPHAALSAKVPTHRNQVRSTWMAKTRRTRATTEHLARHRMATDRSSEEKKLCRGEAVR